MISNTHMGAIQRTHTNRISPPKIPISNQSIHSNIMASNYSHQNIVPVGSGYPNRSSPHNASHPNYYHKVGSDGYYPVHSTQPQPANYYPQKIGYDNPNIQHSYPSIVPNTHPSMGNRGYTPPPTVGYAHLNYPPPNSAAYYP
eukprot:GHVR01045157.1.p1 GENE.GHVR01045157.1~~GHVR01045157.1.p1  ORF type:complete len:143 (-),score=4.93 GHVR01045157.1:1077-1505(-)